MAVSPEYLAASSRMRQIGRELLRIKQEQIAAALQGPNVLSVVIEPTTTYKIKRIRIELANGTVLQLFAQGIEDVVVLSDPPDARIRKLEKEWAAINKKWHLYP